MHAVIVNQSDVEDVTTPRGLTKFLVRHAAGEGPNIMIRQWAAGTELSRHAHPANEMFYILDGEVEVAGDVLGAGTCLFIPGGCEYGPLRVLQGTATLLRYYESESPSGDPTAPQETS